MREIDLIPSEYGRQRQTRRTLKYAGVLVAALVLAIGGARLALGLDIARLRPIVERLHQDEGAAASAGARVAELEQHKLAVEASLDSLRTLRRGADWKDALQIVDRAFGKGMWMDRLVISAATAPGTADSAERIEIKGHAVEHAAVTEFARALREQPQVHEVRLVDTALRRYSTTQVVDFSIEARREVPTRDTP